MNEFVRKANFVKAETIIKALERRQIEGAYAESREDARIWLLNRIPEGASISWGDSHTLDTLDIKDHFRHGSYTVFDRDAAGNDVTLRTKIMRQAMSCDYYLLSSNAITMAGELVNIDSRGNRCSAISFGPEYVIFVAGINKITADVESALKRIRTDACVPNTIRYQKGTPCQLTGKCNNCTHKNCMCCQILITRFSKVPGRISVLLINDILGF